MKKLFKAISAVTVSAVMSFAVVAFAACGPQNNPDPIPEPEPKPTPGLATGNETYDSIIGTGFAAVTLENAISFGEDGDMIFNAKVNLDGTADIVFNTPDYDYYEYYFVRDWAVYAARADEQTNDFTQSELSGCIDINQVFEAYLDMVKEESGMDIPADIAQLLELNTISNLLVPGTLGGVNYAVLSLAEATDSAVTADETVTVNFNKMAYNMVQDAKSVVDSLDGSTTLGDVLNNKTLKKYLQIVTELTTPQEIIDTVADAAASLGGLGGMPSLLAYDEVGGDDNNDYDYDEGGVETGANWELLTASVVLTLNELLNSVQPDADSTVYDYIVKVLGSQELVDLINGVIQSMPNVPAGVGITKKITEFTLDEIISMATADMETPVSFNDIKAKVNEYIEAYTSEITETEFRVTVYQDEWLSVNNAKIVYEYDANGLKSMSATAEYKAGDSEEEYLVISIDSTLTLSRTAYASSEFATLPAELPEIEDFDINGGSGRPGGDIIVTPDPSYKNISGSTIYLTDYNITPFVDMTDEELEEAYRNAEAIVASCEDMAYFDVDGVYYAYIDGELVLTLYYEQDGEHIRFAETLEELEEGLSSREYIILGDFIEISRDSAGLTITLLYEIVSE